MKKKKIFIKTKSIPQLEKEFGKNWRWIVGWNIDGYMDHLAGEMLKCDNGESWSGAYFFDKKTHTTWWLPKSSYREITLKEKINKLLEI